MMDGAKSKTPIISKRWSLRRTDGVSDESRGGGVKKNRRVKIVTAPRGRFIQKHQRQEMWSVNTPPIRGPATEAIPQVEPM